jgi:hypothetical protein
VTILVHASSDRNGPVYADMPCRNFFLFWISYQHSSIDTMVYLFILFHYSMAYPCFPFKKYTGTSTFLFGVLHTRMLQIVIQSKISATRQGTTLHQNVSKLYMPQQTFHTPERSSTVVVRIQTIAFITNVHFGLY